MHRRVKQPPQWLAADSQSGLFRKTPTQSVSIMDGTLDVVSDSRKKCDRAERLASTDCSELTDGFWIEPVFEA